MQKFIFAILNFDCDFIQITIQVCVARVFNHFHHSIFAEDNFSPSQDFERKRIKKVRSRELIIEKFHRTTEIF